MVQLVREPTPSLHLTLGAAFGNIATKCQKRTYGNPLINGNHRPCGLVQDWLMLPRKPSDLTSGEMMPTH